MKGRALQIGGALFAAIAAGALSLRCAMVEEDTKTAPSLPAHTDADTDTDAAPPPVPAPGPVPPPAPAPVPAPVPAPAPAPPAAPDTLEAALDDAFPSLPNDAPEDEAPAAQLIVREDRGRHSFVLASCVTGVETLEPWQQQGSREPRETYTFKLLKLSRTTDAAGVETFQLLTALTIVEGVLGEDAENDCQTATELRMRDVDRDGESELTAIVAAAIYDYDEEHTERECVVHAVIAGADDLAPQLTVERENSYQRSDVWTQNESHVTRTWRYEDVDQDGHPDLQLVQTTDSNDYDAPDGCDPDEPPTPEHRERHHDRVSWTCPYDAARDLWACPADAQLAQPRRVRPP